MLPAHEELTVRPEYDMQCAQWTGRDSERSLAWQRSEKASWRRDQVSLVRERGPGTKVTHRGTVQAKAPRAEKGCQVDMTHQFPVWGQSSDCHQPAS